MTKLITLLMALILAGCGSAVAGSPGVGTTVSPLPTDQVVFQVWTGGGLVPP